MWVIFHSNSWPLTPHFYRISIWLDAWNHHSKHGTTCYWPNCRIVEKIQKMYHFECKIPPPSFIIFCRLRQNFLIVCISSQHVIPINNVFIFKDKSRMPFHGIKCPQGAINVSCVGCHESVTDWAMASSELIETASGSVKIGLERVLVGWNAEKLHFMLWRRPEGMPRWCSTCTWFPKSKVPWITPAFLHSGYNPRPYRLTIPGLDSTLPSGMRAKGTQLSPYWIIQCWTIHWCVHLLEHTSVSISTGRDDKAIL